ncbi:hypothetical protein [Nonomuraea sp. GTA35]|uniref:hypothetical protein n=1 Tax=Nonomuraea sp. GTA35 TaxID=1676746 RepID=UPI0035BF9153
MTRRSRAYLALPVLLIAAGILWLVRGGDGGPGAVELAGRGAHYAVHLALEPGTGPRDVRIRVEPRPAEVSVFAVMPHMGHTTPELAAPPDGTGRFVARGELFTMSGAWELGIRVRGSRGTEVITIKTLVGEGE